MAVPDIVVVGGGVIGLAVAYELAAEQRRVLLLERHTLGHGASGVGGGFITTRGQSQAAGLALVRESLERYDILPDQLGADLGLRRCGSLVLAADENEREQLGQRHAEHEAAGPGATLLTGDAVRELEPQVAPTVVSASWCPADLQLDPPRLLAAYRAGLERLGGEVREGRTVHALLRAGDRVTGVRTQFGDLDAGEVILATGCWTPVLMPPAYAGIIRPRRGQALLARPRLRCIRHLLLGCDYWSAKFGDGEVGFALEQNVDGVLRLGGSREWAGYDSRPTALLDRIQANAKRYVTWPEDVTWTVARAGLRPSTPDGLPLLGQIAPGLWLAAGHEGAGFAQAPATAARLAAALRGRLSELRPYHPGRFMTPPDA